MEAPSAGELERFAHNCSARLDYRLLRLLKINSINYDKRSAGRVGIFFAQAAFESAIGEARVVGAVVSELPAERLLVELLACLDIRGGEFDVVDPQIVLLLLRHC